MTGDSVYIDDVLSHRNQPCVYAYYRRAAENIRPSPERLNAKMKAIRESLLVWCDEADIDIAEPFLPSAPPRACSIRRDFWLKPSPYSFLSRPERPDPPADLVAWFRATSPPAAPFRLNVCVTVPDPARYWGLIESDLAGESSWFGNDLAGALAELKSAIES